MKSSPFRFIDQTLVDADVVATNRVARKPPKPDVNNLEAPEQIIVEFAPQPIHRNGQDPGPAEHGRCASAGAAERAAALRSGDTRRSTAGGADPRGDDFGRGAVNVGACDRGTLAPPAPRLRRRRCRRPNLPPAQLFRRYDPSRSSRLFWAGDCGAPAPRVPMLTPRADKRALKPCPVATRPATR